LGNFTGLETHPLLSSAIIGILGSATSIPVNIVNALNIAESTGLSVQEKFSKSIEPYENLVQVTVITDQRSEKVSATSTSAGVEIVSIGKWNINFIPVSKILLLVENIDQPGEVGRVGQIMGDLGVNISSMAVAPGIATDDPALMVIGISRSLDQSEALQISELTGISRVRQVTL
jgi:D-3-phosphoglycerate dehydrogenase